eukprot:m.158211 g.158211  ORF g.158211 m.158211 type:complete len:892 (+) comp20876_c1_seq3:1064-3739(+)
MTVPCGTPGAPRPPPPAAALRSRRRRCQCLRPFRNGEFSTRPEACKKNATHRLVFFFFFRLFHPMRVALALLWLVTAVAPSCGHSQHHAKHGGISVPHHHQHPRTRAEPDWVAAAQGVLQRTFGAQYLPFFKFFVIPAVNGMDVFTVETSNGQVLVGGNNGVSLASGLYYYAKNISQLVVTWGFNGTGNNAEFPQPLPTMPGKVEIVSQVKYRYYMNVCTVSYSMAFWDWRRWQQEIDWMALHGVNLALSFTGQEYVWHQFYSAIGMTDAEILAYFSGPAFLAWQRMGNLKRWGGPLAASWRLQQRDLQLLILNRTRELGIINALPGFSGHVPDAILRIFPNAKVQRSDSWDNFNATYGENYLLEPTDPNFVPLGQKFYEILIKEFGTDHVYQSDTYNEMAPTSNDTTFLRESNAAVYNAMAAVDKDAIYLMQGWLFLEPFWTTDAVKAYLSGVPDDGMIILDLASESAPQFQRLGYYYGKQWIWCMLHNFGGRRGLYGFLAVTGSRPLEDLHSSNGSMAGIGMTMEAIEQNPVMYELLTEMYWRTSAVDVSAWIQNYGIARCGGSDNAYTRAAWLLLLDGCYGNSQDTSLIEADPYSLNWYSTHNTNATLTADAWFQLFSAAISGSVDAAVGPYQYDLVDVGRQVLCNYFDDVHDLFVHEYLEYAVNNRSSAAAISRVGTALLDILKDLDQLLGTNVNYLLGVWLNMAKAWGSTPTEVALLDFNARNQITLWGPDGNNNDYAAKHWNGLVGDYYYHRYKLFVDACVAAATNHSLVNFEMLGQKLDDLMFGWQQMANPYPDTPSGDVMAITYNLIKKYYMYTGETKFVEHEHTDMVGGDISDGPIWTKNVAQLKSFCAMSSDCIGFNSLGLLKNVTSSTVSKPGVTLYLKA